MEILAWIVLRDTC